MLSFHCSAHLRKGINEHIVGFIKLMALICTIRCMGLEYLYILYNKYTKKQQLFYNTTINFGIKFLRIY